MGLLRPLSLSISLIAAQWIGKAASVTRGLPYGAGTARYEANCERNFSMAGTTSSRRPDKTEVDGSSPSRPTKQVISAILRYKMTAHSLRCHQMNGRQAAF